MTITKTSPIILKINATDSKFPLRDSWLHEQQEEDNQQSYIHMETCPYTLTSAAKVTPYVLSDVGGQKEQLGC